MSRLYVLCLGLALCLFSFQTNAQWTKHTNFPEGANVTDMAADNNGVIYILVGSEIYYTTNSGANWTLVPNTQNHWLIYDIDVNKTNGRLYAASLLGIHWTGNQGQQWQQQTFTGGGPGGPIAIGFYKIAVKQGTNTVVAAAENEVAMTPNGNNWNLYQGLPLQQAFELKFLANGDLLAGGEGGIYQSVNNGVNWAPLHNGIQNMRIVSVAQNTGNNYLYAAADKNTNTNDTTGTGIYISTDNGATWVRSSAGITNRTARAVMVDANGDVYAATANGIYLSTNNGASWNSINSGLQDTNATALVRTSAGLFSGTRNAGVAHATTSVWSHRNTGLHINGVEGMAVTQGADLFLLAPNALYQRTAAATTWQGPMMFPNVTGRILRRDHTGKLYLATNTHVQGTGSVPGLFVSTNGGNSWTDITANLPAPSSLPYTIEQVEISANNDVYILANIKLTSFTNATHVYISANGGSSFTAPIQTPAAGFARINHMAVAPNGDIYFVGQNSLNFPINIMVGHATNLGTSISTIPVSNIKLFLNSRIYVDRNNVPYINRYDSLYKYTGSNWTMLSAANGTPTDMRLYFDNDNDIYMVSQNAIQLSKDGGNSWHNVSAGIPVFTGVGGATMLSLTDLQFDSNDTAYAYSTDVETAAAPYRGVYKFSGQLASNIAAVSTQPSFTVYPNPCNGQLNVMPDKPGAVHLYSLPGQLIKTKQATGSEVSFDMSGLATGIYIVKMNGQAIRVVKE